MEYIAAVVVALIGLGATMLVRALRFGRPQPPVEPAEQAPIDVDAAAAHLAAAVACQTVSHGPDAPVEAEAFAELHARLAEMYPLVYRHLDRQVIAGYSLLYTWPGSDPTLKPVLLMAHQDVAPVDPATAGEWAHPPFTTGVIDGCVWGRGTLDCKGQMIGELEAVEYLLGQGFRPQRTVYLAFGHNEEVGGAGAQAIAEWLQVRGVRLEALLDEGGAVVQGMLPGVSAPLALVGNAEKSYLTLELSVSQPPGHAAMPPRHTAVGILARAIVRLEARPLPARLDAMMPMFEGIGTALPPGLRLVLANTWLLGGVVRRILSRSATTNAAIRTTAAATVIAGGVKDNIIPAEARALVNFRLLPGDTAQAVIDAVGRTIDDPRVTLQARQSFGGKDATVSPIDGPAFARLSAATRQVFGDVPVAPYLV
ncbi:MAG: M20/M25/M40 family metallo-hydrolase, partial [Anaerolineae bacterium]|nr:M20/M25/M40 family metallo-hydrolase [Anaerolineae bacterium]